MVEYLQIRKKIMEKRMRTHIKNFYEDLDMRFSDLEDISSSLLPKINSIYDELIKPEVHNRW